MRHGIAIVLAIQTFCSLVSAVLVDDAFVKDWVTHNYSDLVKCAILDSESVVCLSKAGLLYLIGLKDTQIRYFIDLRKIGADDFAIRGASIISSSESNSDVYVWNKKTGILQNAIVEHSNLGENGISDSAYPITEGDSGEKTTQIDDKHILSWSPKSVDIVVGEAKFQISKSSATVIDAKVLTDGSATYIAVVSPEAISVHSISKFLTNGDKSSISSFELPYSGEFSDIVCLDDSVMFLTSTESDFTMDVVKPGKDLRALWTLPKSQLSFSGKTILVNKPLSLSTIDKVHHLVEDSQSKSILFRWVMRVKTHLAQIGKYAMSLSSSKNENSNTHEVAQDQYGFQKILVSYDPEKSTMFAKESTDGSLLWSQSVSVNGHFLDLFSIDSLIIVVSSQSAVSVDLRTGHIEHSESFHNIEQAFVLHTEQLGEEEEDEGKSLRVVALKMDGRLKVWNSNLHPAAAQFVLTEENGFLHAYKLAGENLVPTWTYGGEHENIISVSKNGDDLTTAIGISRSDRSVLYKYLNPNLVCVVSERGAVLKITLLDGITGTIVHVQEHAEAIDMSSVLVLQNDNWVIYTYQVNNPTVEQRIVVVDLFTLGSNAAGGEKSVLEGTFNSSIAQVSTKAFIFPERIVALRSTTTKFGITVRSVVALTESGSLVELPKFVLNSRRIDDRKMTQQDAEDDFHMMPYDPVVPVNPTHVLNHKIQLQLSPHQQILMLPTKMESSAVVCAVNELNAFCTVVQPSLSYDILSSGFDRTKLAITIAVLFVGVLVSRPFVDTKKLNANWVD